MQGHVRTYQEYNRDVEHEGAETVEEESEKTDVVDLSHGATGNLPDQGNDTVHDSTDRSKVVKRDKGVHLVVSRAQKSLNHGQSKSLEDDATDLEKYTGQDKVNFSHGGNDDTDDDGRNVEELLQVWRGHTKSPAREKDSDRGGGLEHLDESDRQVQVCQIAENETQREEDTDGHDSTEVDTTGHLDSLSAIKKRSPSSHNLSHNCRESQVVGCEDNGVA